MVSSTAAVTALAARLRATVTRPWTLMEVCGGQTHAIVRWGLDQLLPDGLRLIHGPGCPVCVTPAASINQALALARRPEVILCAYGDMLRVPGSEPGDDLLRVRAAGGDVRLLTSPLQAIALAQSHPAHQVVFLAVGFETTAPATALLAQQTARLGLANLSLLMAHVRVGVQHGGPAGLQQLHTAQHAAQQLLGLEAAHHHGQPMPLHQGVEFLQAHHRAHMA
ncbi:hydrogenase formation protein HypD, partial [Cyanobium sp. LEGE 06143]|nr:hydrogenase formation protein HypD [Cyanobium sp. LEGE 06143]